MRTATPHPADPPTLDCVRCGYPLVGLAESGDCPECGLPVAVSDEVFRQARSALGAIASGISGALGASAMLGAIAAALVIPSAIVPLPCGVLAFGLLLAHLGTLVSAGVHCRRIPQPIAVRWWQRWAIRLAVILGACVPVVPLLAGLAFIGTISGAWTGLGVWIFAMCHVGCVVTVGLTLVDVARELRLRSEGRWLERCCRADAVVLVIGLAVLTVMLDRWGSPSGGAVGMALVLIGSLLHLLMLIPIGVLAELLRREIAARRGGWMTLTSSKYDPTRMAR